jgi:ribosomal protein S18 acetylase RimI-like enzyme
VNKQDLKYHRLERGSDLGERSTVTEVVLRRGRAADVEPAVAVWRAAQAARRGGRPVWAEHEERVRGYARRSDAFLLLAEDADDVVGMGLGMRGLADDGAGAPVPELCHIAMIFVAPESWGEGIGGRVLVGVLDEARSRGYERAQLWTHADNARALRLYERHGFRRSGREKDDDFGEWIVHYERTL